MYLWQLLPYNDSALKKRQKGGIEWQDGSVCLHVPWPLLPYVPSSNNKRQRRGIEWQDGSVCLHMYLWSLLPHVPPSNKQENIVAGNFSLFTCTFGHCCHTYHLQISKGIEWQDKLVCLHVGMRHLVKYLSTFIPPKVGTSSRTMPRLCLKQTAAERFGQSTCLGRGTG